ncbi:MAG: CDP-alcohol phosphatidyltransferase family protein [Sphingobacteriia bacterium]|nr:MAG: CDP-alcohol phosphatidyltransferase family protein [Sphingobacteriia bacterium]TAH08667.1 MAG: CDP-alcohol phosphatidyltransferase family protein [Sphingobacteriia bacterium]
MKYKIIWNIPNMLSCSRIVFTPIILFLIFYISKQHFAIIFIVFQLTDIADGYIARKYNMQTKMGAILDSWGDLCSYLIAFTAMVFYYHEFFVFPRSLFFIFFASLIILNTIRLYRKYGVVLFGLHTILAKITFYIQSIFLVVLFFHELVHWLYYLAFFIGVLREIETLFIIKKYAHLPLSVKSIFSKQ